MTTRMNASNQNSGNLKDMESKLNTLERANFDLKMKLHYLNKKYVNSNSSTNDVPEGVMMMGDTQIDVIALKEESEYSKRRILELESELLQLQLLRDRESHEFQKALKMKPSSDTVQQDENRKREREVAKAIAEHDAALIKKLQEESTILQKQHDKDKELVDNLTNELAKTKLLLEERESELEKLQGKNKDLQLKIELLKEERDYEDNHNNNGLVPVSNGGSPHRGRKNQGPPMLFSANTNGQQTSILINSNAFTAATSVAPPQSPYPYNRQAPPPQHPSTFLLQTNPHQQPAPQLPYPQQNGYPQGINQSFNGSYYDNQASSMNGDSPAVVFQENQVLRDRLGKLQESIKMQENIINNMKTSAKEFSSIESEEIKRLEKELDTLLDEKEKMRQKYQKLEVELEISTQQLQQYRRYYGPLDISAISMANPYLQQQMRYGPGGMAMGNGAQAIHRNVLEIQQYERTIEQYRLREAELIAALEGVVKRCQELENQQQQMRANQSKQLKLR
eukprot:gene9644-10472_t